MKRFAVVDQVEISEGVLERYSSVMRERLMRNAPVAIHVILEMTSDKEETNNNSSQRSSVIAVVTILYVCHCLRCSAISRKQRRDRSAFN